jgi:hypothetical protein
MSSESLGRKQLCTSGTVPRPTCAGGVDKRGSTVIGVMPSLAFAFLDRGIVSAPTPPHLLTKLRISDFLDLIIPGLAIFLMLHGPEGRTDKL